MRIDGWLLDVSFEDSQAVLWVRDPELGRIKLNEPYYPELYAEPKGVAAEELKASIEEHPGIRSVAVVKRVSTIRRNAESTVLRIGTRGVDTFRDVARLVERLPLVARIYDADLSHELKYLSERGLTPFGAITVESDGEGGIRSIHATELGLDAHPPPIHVLSFEADTSRDHGSVTVLDRFMKPTYAFEGETEGVVRDFLDYFADEDPDVVCAGNASLGLIIRLGHVYESSRFGRLAGSEVELFGGRIHVEPYAWERLGFAGLVERSMFTRVPLRLCVEWAAGKCIDARQCYEARRRGILVPRAADYQPVMSLGKLLEQDKGGLILAPTVGLHENVALLDFESMFPNIIVKRNVSYETTGVVGDVEGFIAGFTWDALTRRLHFKHRRREVAKGSEEWVWCEERQTALKENLVVIYGYSGCFANRFGSMDTYMEINRQARQSLTVAMAVANERGFSVLYGNSDSLFLTRLGATGEDYEALAAEIARVAGLPMVVEHVFRYLVLLPQKAGAEVGAVNRYYGITAAGELECRGIELRRRDTPPFVGRVQRQVMEALLTCVSRKEMFTVGKERAREIVNDACRQIEEGDVPAEELKVSKVLSREIGEYVSHGGHVTAANALSMNRLRVGPGDLVDYLYVDAGNANPFRRVAPMRLGEAKPDAAKYQSLVRQAAETVLSGLKWE
jgi:DNA polymerase elongation subunit (family B)